MVIKKGQESLAHKPKPVCHVFVKTVLLEHSHNHLLT